MAIYVVLHERNKGLSGSLDPSPLTASIIGSNAAPATNGIAVNNDTFLLRTEENALQIFGRLRSILQPTDRLYIFPMTAGYYGAGSQEVWAWLLNNQQPPRP